MGSSSALAGSMGTDIALRYRNSVELGWAGMIKFNHDFVGRKALEREVANPRRKMVTLEWNTEDIVDVYASQFQPGEPGNAPEGDQGNGLPLPLPERKPQ